MSKLNYVGLSDRGRLRPQNEDNWFGDAQGGLFMVSDGMGGRSAGELASKIVVEVLPLLIRQRMEGIKDLALPSATEKLQALLCDLSGQLRAQTQGEPGLAGMGATVVLALLRRNQALIAHLGDSRVYLVRRGRLKRLTKDDTVVQFLLDTGEITPGEASTHPARNRLTRFMGMPGDPLPHVQFLGLRDGDRLLLCSDGLTSMVSDEQLRSILKRKTGIQATCRELLAAANNAGGRDNITVIVVDWI